MEEYTPVTLMGDTLGDRHRNLNSLVANAAKRPPSDGTDNVPETSTIDRLFKIGVAVKLRDVDYILLNLQNDDLLYVSKALKSKWLLEPQYRSIINPVYLEEVLYPTMVTTAISKMRHWLYINLRDPERCLEFYRHYKDCQFEFAIKFLYHCDKDIMQEEFRNILIRISPHHLKIFSETNAELAKVYFDSLAMDTEVARLYLQNAQAYHRSIKGVLKSNAGIFREITEKYNEYHLSHGESAHIMRHHKEWFLAKPELYTACLLHLPTVARGLSAEESEDVILKLARANYLSWWFSYVNVEPLVKRVPLDKRAAFKKLVFVDKDVGEHIEKWPYSTPAAPVIPISELHVFDDVDPEPWFTDGSSLCIPRKRKYARWRTCKKNKEAELDRLFNEFRFTGFGRTFYELSRRLAAVRSLESRRYIFLVLVSKTGGRADCVSTLLELLGKHINEPSNLRAAVIRSLAKRASMWRLPEDAWSKLMSFGHGLGLDGGPAEEECMEGLHAVILRHFISDEELNETLRVAFLDRVTSFLKYTLTASERTKVISCLTHLLIVTAAQSEPEKGGKLLYTLYHILREHKVFIDAKSELVAAVTALVDRDYKAAEDILSVLFNARVARKELFMANFLFIREDRAYINVLRHNPKLLMPEKITDALSIQRDCLKQFMKKVSIYFNEKGGIAEQLVTELKKLISTDPKSKYVRPLVTIIGGGFKEYLEIIDRDISDDIKKVSIAAALRANAHHTRPRFDVDSLDPSKIGAKAMANKSLICEKRDIEKYVDKLLSWRRTVRIGLILAQRGNIAVDAFARGIEIRPLATFKVALEYISRPAKYDDVVTIWNTVKQKFSAFDVNKRRKRNRVISKIDNVPPAIKVDFCVTLFLHINKKENAVEVMYKHLEAVLPDMSGDQFDDVLSAMIENLQTCEVTIICPNPFIKYLLMTETEEEQTRRLEHFGQKFLDSLEMLIKKNSSFINDFNRTLQYLKNNRVFFDARYVSCLPVFARILKWMKEMFPIEKHFESYAEIHLTILYYTSIMHAIQKVPAVFNDPDRKRNEGVDLVGVLFGRYIVRDLRVLMETYFESIVELFIEALEFYIDKYFISCSSTKQFFKAVVTGILADSIGRERDLALSILQNQNLDLPDIFKEAMEKHEELKFFFYAQEYI